MYKYKNIKHVMVYGLKPGQSRWYPFPVGGGGLALVDEKEDTKSKKKTKESDK